MTAFTDATSAGVTDCLTDTSRRLVKGIVQILARVANAETCAIECFYFCHLFLSLITCTIFIGDTITTIACLFNYKCLLFKATQIVVWQPSGYMVCAFHWQNFNSGDMALSTYKLKRYFFRTDRRIASKFCTHVRIDTLTLKKFFWPTPPQGVKRA